VIELAPHQNSVELAQQIRLTCLEMCYNKRASHIGGAFSIADVLAVMYTQSATEFFTARVTPAQPFMLSCNSLVFLNVNYWILLPTMAVT
jgi:transketolase N-terminal domain/subunit